MLVAFSFFYMPLNLKYQLINAIGAKREAATSACLRVDLRSKSNIRYPLMSRRSGGEIIQIITAPHQGDSRDDCVQSG